MGRSSESFQKKEVRNKKEKKRKDKEKKKAARKMGEKTTSLDDMIAYVDENGMLTNTPPDPTVKKEVIALEGIEISTPKKEDQEEIDPVHKGIVSFFNDSKGYGFIRDLETRESVYVHANNTLEDISEGNKVEFEIEKGPKGFMAVRVKQSK